MYPNYPQYPSQPPCPAQPLPIYQIGPGAPQNFPLFPPHAFNYYGNRRRYPKK